MASTLLLYSSVYELSKKICERIQASLASCVGLSKGMTMTGASAAC